MSDLDGNPEDCFSRVTAHLSFINMLLHRLTFDLGVNFIF